MSFAPTLTETTLTAAVKRLARRDRDLAGVVRAHGVPPLWAREPGFATLVLLILEQQVSLASARACFEKLRGRLGGLDPARLCAIDEDTRLACGVSRQKAGYICGLAQAVAAGALDLDDIAAMPDAEARAALTRIRGIGAWTSDIYLLMALGRPDIWPVGDLALATAAGAVKGLAERPTAADLEELGEAWRPWRAVAARILWHHYLATAKSRAAVRRERGTRREGS
jgi:DNA-3-methyladenine glycosylase II